MKKKYKKITAVKHKSIRTLACGAALIIGSTSLRLHFLPHARFFEVQRGGGHGPSGPVVNTPLVKFELLDTDYTLKL